MFSGQLFSLNFIAAPQSSAVHCVRPSFAPVKNSLSRYTQYRFDFMLTWYNIFTGENCP